MVTHSQSAARWRQLSESMCTGGCLAGRLWVPRWQVGCLAGWLPEGCTGHVRRRSSPQSSLRAWSSTAIVKSTSALVQHMGGLMRKTLPARPAAAEQHSRTAVQQTILRTGQLAGAGAAPKQRWLARQGRHLAPPQQQEQQQQEIYPLAGSAHSPPLPSSSPRSLQRSNTWPTSAVAGSCSQAGGSAQHT